MIVEPLRVLADAIVGYALQLLALARHDPEKQDAIAVALAPIDEFRTSAGRRVGGDDDDGEEEEPETEAPTPTVRPSPAPVMPILSAVEDLTSVRSKTRRVRGHPARLLSHARSGTPWWGTCPPEVPPPSVASRTTGCRGVDYGF